MAIRSRIGHSIVGGMILSQFSAWKNLRVQKDTVCCIEGYPRCANTFAVVAFESAQTTKVKLAHHSHLAGQVLLAARRNLPILLLIRQPQDAIASLMMLDPNVTSMMLLKDYARFYSALIPIIDNLQVADFDQVTGDFGRVIKRLNEKYHTSFTPFQHTPEHVERCMKKIEDIDCRCGGRKFVLESQVPRPSDHRKHLANKFKMVIKQKKNQKALSRCEELYRVFFDKA
jgi:hypothetical protein